MRLRADTFFVVSVFLLARGVMSPQVKLITSPHAKLLEHHNKESIARALAAISNVCPILKS